MPTQATPLVVHYFRPWPCRPARLLRYRVLEALSRGPPWSAAAPSGQVLTGSDAASAVGVVSVTGAILTSRASEVEAPTPSSAIWGSSGMAVRASVAAPVASAAPAPRSLAGTEGPSSGMESAIGWSRSSWEGTPAGAPRGPSRPAPWAKAPEGAAALSLRRWRGSRRRR